MAGTFSTVSPSAFPLRSLEQMPVPAYVCGPDGAILEFNLRIINLWGRTPDGASRFCTAARVLTTTGEVLAPEQLPVARVLRGEIAETSQLLVVERADGTRATVLDHVTPLLDASGHPMAAFGVQVDVAGNVWAQHTERALRMSDERLRIALDAGRLGAWQFNPQTHHLVTTAQCKANHGLGPGDTLEFEAGILAAIPPEFRERLVEVVEKALREHGGFEIEVPNMWPDGTMHWLRIAGCALDAACVVGITQDVTERYQWEERLEEISRRKDLFIATLGHELRQPLSAIVLALAVLKARTAEALDPVSCGVIERQVDHLRCLVDDLIDSARIAQGKFALDLRPLDLREPLRNALEVVQAEIDRRRQRLDICGLEQAVMVMGESDRLQQVFSNVLVNATKYTDEGGAIRVHLCVEGGSACVSIQDTGVGIAPELLPRIFDIFMQVNSRSGLGLGLPVVKRLVELHGGTVQVASEGAGRGTRFDVRFLLLNSY